MKASRTGKLGLLAAAILALLMVSLPGSAAAKDRNRDRIPDRWEKQHKLSLKKNQRRLDQDRDGLRNRGEWLSGTNPRDRDSDDDGTPDGKENAGFVAGYDAETGRLTITLYAGGEISGAVTKRTEVECEGDSGDESGNQSGARRSAAVSSHPERQGSEGSGGSRPDDEAEDEDESGDDESEDHESEEHESEDHEGSGGSCSIADLAEGVVIHEADVRYTSAGAVFRELEIEKPVSGG